MGEITEDILDGIVCQMCGIWMPEVDGEDTEKIAEFFRNPPGHPRTCEDCRKDIKWKKKKK